MIRFLLTLALICTTGITQAQSDAAAKFEEHLMEVLFSDSEWVKSPNLCARGEECIFALEKSLVIIKSKEAWLKVGYVIKHPFATEQEEAIFVQPCYMAWIDSCLLNPTNDFDAQIFIRADYLFKEAMRKR